MARIRWERDQFLPYFRRLADQLGLKDWEIRIDGGNPEDPDALAAATGTEAEDLRIDLADGFLRETDSVQRDYAVHEVLHAHHCHEYHLLRKLLTDEQFRIYLLAHEYAHDGIAMAVAPLMPLPSDVLGGGDTRASE